MKELKVSIGEQVTFAKTVAESDVYMFAGITGDFSVNHVNEEYMKGTLYGKRIVHGALLIGFFMHRHGHFGWLTTVLTAIAVPVVFFLIFERWFLVPLAKGAFNQSFMSGKEYTDWVAKNEALHIGLMKDAGFIAK